MASDVAHLPGVMAVEATRVIQARLRAGSRSRTVAISGLPEDPRLTRVIDRTKGVVALPPSGVVLSRMLGDVPALRPGHSVQVEVLEGRRPVRQIFAAIIAGGVVYNSARVSLSERSRELASLRVLGFTRAEISLILLEEIAVLMTVALPLGAAIGYLFGRLIMAVFTNEVYRLSFVVSPSTVAWTWLTVIGATVVSGLLVRRRLDRLDLIAVLKTPD